MLFRKTVLCSLLLLGLTYSITAQNGVIPATQYLEANLPQFNADNATEWIVTDATQSPNGMSNIYFNQSYRGILVENEMVNIHLQEDGEIIYAAGDFIPALSQKISNEEEIEVYRAVQVAFEDIDLTYFAAQADVFIGGADKERKLFYPDLLLKPIVAKLIYVPLENGEVRLTWAVSIYLQNGQHWWQFKIDAENATIVKKRDLVISCSFDAPNPNAHCHIPHHFHPKAQKN